MMVPIVSGQQVDTRAKFTKHFFLCCMMVFIVSCSGPSYVPVYSARYDTKPLQLTYKVRKKDTLFSIAWRYQIDYKELARVNGIARPFRIHPGQILMLHSGNVNALDETKYNNKNTAKNNKSKYDKLELSKQYTRSNSLNQGLKSHAKAVNRWIWPAYGKVVPKYSPGKAGRKGLDILGRYGDTVRASARGKVVYSSGGLFGYGNLIIIEHNEEFLSAYAHNSKLLSKEGDFVAAGQKIAEIGSSGAPSSKLYFEIRRKGIPVDPVKYLPKDRK